MLVSIRDKREAWLDGRASTSNGAVLEKQWTELWRMRVPAKVKTFLWRLAKQPLPTNDVCHHRHMADDDRCQLCGARDSWRHAHIECTISRCVWALQDEQITKHIHCSEEGDARAWLAQMIATLKHDERPRVSVTLWSIWHARQKALHEQIYQSPLLVHCFMTNSSRTWERQGKKQTRTALVAPSLGPALIPLPQGAIKINVDVAVSKNTGRGAVVAVARDDTDKFMGASALVYPGKTEADTLDALACREGVALAKDIYARRVRLASDNVIQNLQQGTRGVYAHIVQEIVESRGEFEELIFSHEKRCSNREAHNLARFSVLDEHGRKVWLIILPKGACIPLLFLLIKATKTLKKYTYICYFNLN
jgi:ribonuclease HI